METLLSKFITDKIDQYESECEFLKKNVTGLVLSDSDIKKLEDGAIKPMKELFESGFIVLKERWADGLNLNIRGGKYYCNFSPSIDEVCVWWESNNQWIGYDRQVLLEKSESYVGHVIRTLHSISSCIRSLIDKKTDEFMWFYLREKYSEFGIPQEETYKSGFRKYP